MSDENANLLYGNQKDEETKFYFVKCSNSLCSTHIKNVRDILGEFPIQLLIVNTPLLYKKRVFCFNPLRVFTRLYQAVGLAVCLALLTKSPSLP